MMTSTTNMGEGMCKEHWWNNAEGDVLRTKPVLVPMHPQQSPRGPDWDWTCASCERLAELQLKTITNVHVISQHQLLKLTEEAYDIT